MDTSRPLLPPLPAPPRQLIHHASRGALFHLIRTPWYVLRAVARIPRSLHSWVNDKAGEPDYRNALAARQGDLIKLEEYRATRRRKRSGLVTLVLGLTVVAVVLADWYLGPWAWKVTVAAGLAVLAFTGHPAKPAPALESGPDPEPAPPPREPVTLITHTSVTNALASALPEITRALKDDPHALRYPDPPARDGNGWSVRVELPPGVTAAQVGAQQPKLASAFRRPPLAVTVEPDPAHNAMVQLWVGDAAPSGDVMWHHATDPGPVDILAGFHVGVDLRNRPVKFSLQGRNALIGAQPGFGKTVTLRMILCAAALDPRVDIYAYDLKSGSDLLPLERVAVRVVSGDEDEDILQLRDDLIAIRNEIRTRNQMIKALPDGQRPDGKITTADATRLGIRLIVFAIDEAQIAYAHPTYGKEIAQLTEDVFRRSRSVGIHVLLATQQFDDASVPKAITRNAVLRMCGKVDGWQESNMILGPNAHGSGVTATVFGDSDQGVMWVKGAGPTRIVRMANLEEPEARAVIHRAAQARNVSRETSPPAADVSRETSFALAALPAPHQGPDPDAPPASDTLGRVLHVWPDSERTLWTETILGLLREAFPGEYASHTPGELSKLIPRPSRQVKKSGTNRQGYARVDLA